MDYDMKVEVAVLQSVVYKIDSAVAEIAKSSTEVTRLLAVHDSRIGSLELDSRETTTDVRDLYKKMNENTKEIVEKLEDITGEQSELISTLTSSVIKIDEVITQLDSSGAFESDDEIGTFFEQIKNMRDTLLNNLDKKIENNV